MAKAKAGDDNPMPVAPGVVPEEAPARPSKAAPAFGDHGTPRAADPGPLPRVVHELDRAPAGAVRFKVRCNNYGPPPVRYLLVAADKDEAMKAAAEECYAKSVGLDRQLADLRRRNVPDVVEPELVVTKLPD
jgi:hypothetical protein